MHRTLRTAALAVALAAVAALSVAPAASADAPLASAAGSCQVGDGRGLGPTYVTRLGVKKVSCATGKKVVRAYQNCRVRNGGKRGRCGGKAAGFRCSEKRGASIPTQFDATVTCRKGKARVAFAYTQFT